MEKLPRLDARLAAIASMVRDGARCADIGTDHGYLIAWLLASGKAPFGFACDINQKPLEKAAFTLSAYRVRHRAKLLLCDGLADIRPGQVDDIVIAGMGGDLIWEILSRPDWTRDAGLRFLLQPMTKHERLRRALYANGFAILREKAVVSRYFPYIVMQAAYTGQTRELDDASAWVGELLTSPDPAARQYVAKVARQVREKVEGLKRSSLDSEELARYAALLEKLEGGN
ncbi:class I SAM-dependent methyltransferase [Anaerotruncus rubiinfantis]|uniref:class I SAM-dependent methyltransferase n=1 Tax=Anaerotruncus rubiinfantis TaxID=1720200 RepID=UPI0011C8653F|nr:class I SAM-dependent methyltransferase [Anaerotruncus rubiinfantis]